MWAKGGDGMNLPDKVKNPWAVENSPYASGYRGMPLELYLCPICGAHPSMVDEDSVWQGGRTLLLCMECGFGARPQNGAVKATEMWNRAVEHYVDYCNKGLVKE